MPLEVYNAVITANGALTPSYQYITELRAINEKLKDTESESSVGMQGFTLQLTGHLFDKQIFNRILDMFENRGVNFRVVSWQFGQDSSSKTSVVMQGLSLFDEELDKVEQEIIEFAKNEDVQCLKVKGPAVDQPLSHAKEYL